MSNSTIFINLDVEGAAKERAEKLGVNYSEIMLRYEINPRMIGAARGVYTTAARKNGWDDEARIGIIADEKFDKYCMAYMLNRKDWEIAEPPTVKKTVEEETERHQVRQDIPNEDVLLTLEALTKAINANTVQLINLRDQLHKDHRESLAKIRDERTAKAAEDVSMAIKTTNRTLDAMDNKLNVIITASQRLEGKIDRGNNAAIDSANKLKAIVEGVSGILNKITRICALYDKK